jgi:hypothetical protein
MDNNEPIVEVDFNNLSFEQQVALSAFFDSEGNQYEKVHSESPSFVNAVNTLLATSGEVKRNDCLDSELVLTEMENMGFYFAYPPIVVDGKETCWYLPILCESLDIPTSRLNFETVMVHNDDKQALRIYAAQLRQARGCSLPTDSKILSQGIEDTADVLSGKLPNDD